MLTEKSIRNAKSRKKPYKLFDDRGLYILIQPNNSRWWRLKYFNAGKQNCSPLAFIQMLV